MPLTSLHMCRYLSGMFDPLNPTTLSAARKAAGLTRSELALAAQVSETTILRIEKGEVDPRLKSTWEPIARALASKVAETQAAA